MPPVITGEAWLERVCHRKENLVFSLTYGYPLSRRLGLKASYVGVRAQPSIGADTDTLLVALTTFW